MSRPFYGVLLGTSWRASHKGSQLAQLASARHPLVRKAHGEAQGEYIGFRLRKGE